VIRLDHALPCFFVSLLLTGWFEKRFHCGRGTFFLLPAETFSRRFRSKPVENNTRKVGRSFANAAKDKSISPVSPLNCWPLGKTVPDAAKE